MIFEVIRTSFEELDYGMERNHVPMAIRRQAANARPCPEAVMKYGCWVVVLRGMPELREFIKRRGPVRISAGDNEAAGWLVIEILDSE